MDHQAQHPKCLESSSNRSQSADMWKSKAVPLQMRESCKMACSRIAACLQTRINSSKNAQRKAELMKALDGSEHDIYFSQVCHK